MRFHFVVENVKIGDKNYTVVKRKNVLTIPENFMETTVVINNEEVPAFYKKPSGCRCLR